MGDAAVPLPAADVAPVVVTTPWVNRVVHGPLALVFGVLFLTPYWYAWSHHDWKAPGQGDATTSIVGYVLTGVLAALMLLTVPFLFRFHVELWPDRIRKRILLGHATLRLADAKHVIVTPAKDTPRGFVAEKWLVTGTSTRGRRFRVVLDLGLLGEIPGAKDVLHGWIDARPELEPSLFGRTSTQIHPEL